MERILTTNKLSCVYSLWALNQSASVNYGAKGKNKRASAKTAYEGQIHVGRVRKKFSGVGKASALRRHCVGTASAQTDGKPVPLRRSTASRKIESIFSNFQKKRENEKILRRGKWIEVFRRKKEEKEWEKMRKKSEKGVWIDECMGLGVTWSGNREGKRSKTGRRGSVGQTGEQTKRQTTAVNCTDGRARPLV